MINSYMKLLIEALGQCSCLGQQFQLLLQYQPLGRFKFELTSVKQKVFVPNFKLVKYISLAFDMEGYLRGRNKKHKTVSVSLKS